MLQVPGTRKIQWKERLLLAETIRRDSVKGMKGEGIIQNHALDQLACDTALLLPVMHYGLVNIKDIYLQICMDAGNAFLHLKIYQTPGLQVQNQTGTESQKLVAVCDKLPASAGPE